MREEHNRPAAARALNPTDDVLDRRRAVWDAAGGMGYPWGPCHRLILLTGDRRGEWARARWGWLTPDLARLEIPASEYKTARPQVVSLSAQARAVAAALPRGKAGLVSLLLLT